MLWAVRWMAEGERILVKALIGTDASAHYRRPGRPGLWAQVMTRLGDPQTWKDSSTSSSSSRSVWSGRSSPSCSSPRRPARCSRPSLLGRPRRDRRRLFNADTLPEALALVPLGVLLSWLSWHILDRLGRVHGAWAQLVLASSPDPELTARVDDLRSSQARIIEAADEARRRIERDLHDGAQQRLVALSLKLGMARKRLQDGGDGADTLVAEAHEEAKLALGELRDLARGIHPAVLTECGLAARDRGARGARAGRRDRRGVPGERLPPATEATAYFVVAECLVNVAKYAQADEVVVVRGRTSAGSS